MTFDASVNLGTMIHLGISLVTALITVGFIYGALKAQIKRVEEQLSEIRASLGCTDDDVAELGEKSGRLLERLARVERDVSWLKGARNESSG